MVNYKQNDVEGSVETVQQITFISFVIVKFSNLTG